MQNVKENRESGVIKKDLCGGVVDRGYCVEVINVSGGNGLGSEKKLVVIERQVGSSMGRS